MCFCRIAVISIILWCGIISSVHGNYLCDYYDCGMGTCKNTSDFPFFSCECEYGWRRPHSDVVDDNSLTFLPCVIPNCTLNYSCQDVLYPPAPSPVYQGNLSYPDLFSPCEWDVCGAGSCVKEPHATHTCLCDKGYENLMNWTIGYCVTQCQLGADCAAEGVTISGNSSKTVKPVSNSTNSQASDSPLASVSGISGCARLARDYARPLIAGFFIILVTAFFMG